MRAAACLALALALPGGALRAQESCRIVAADYTAPTDRYPHGALGDPYEWGAMAWETSCGRALMITLPSELVFEDTAPRLADLDGDGAPEVIVVESHRDRGARLAVWGLTAEGPARITATPAIGQRNRWLAPLGAGDLDGDGRVELAYVDRPHLARILRVWRYLPGEGLVPVAERPGLTNHRYGETTIEGGLRACAGEAELLLADADWQQIMELRLTGEGLSARALGRYSAAALAAALRCP
ncbi:VCBS repeat-containing protein [Pseudooceanicola nanhaiensis]|nr:VCBS repeat-containing protein [Pseudooceanicola nanhaiensis]